MYRRYTVHGSKRIVVATLPPIGKPPIERHWRVPLRTAVVATLTVGAIGVSGAWLISRPPRAVFPPASLAVPQTLLSERDEPPAIPADARVLVRVTVDSSYRDGLPPDTVRLALLLPPRMV